MHTPFVALLAALYATGALAGGWGWGNDNSNNNGGDHGDWNPSPPPPSDGNNNGGWNPPPPPPPDAGNKGGWNPPPPPPPDGNKGGWNPPPPPPPDGGKDGWNANAQGWNPPPPPPPQGSQWGWGKPVQLHPNGNWRKCLDVRGNWFQDGTPVDIYDCNGSPGQNWVLNYGSTKVQVAGQPFCLDAGEWPKDSTQLKIWHCYDNLPAQQWWYTDDKRLALKDSGKCLDLTNGDTCNGNIAQLWQCLNFDTNQIWNF